MGQYKCLVTHFKELAPRLGIVHFLAFEYAFDKIPVFQIIDNFLLQLHFMYQHSPKQLRGLQEILVAFQYSIPKTVKAK